MTFEVITPVLREVVDESREVIRKIKEKTIDHNDARNIIRAGGLMSNSVATDLRIRLAAPRLAEIEARGAE